MSKINFKVKCVDLKGCNGSCYTEGDIYNIVDGYLIDKRGVKLGHGELENLDNVNTFSSSRFESVDENEVLFDWEAFKQGKIAVNCDSKEKANEFMRECEQHDIVWASGDKATHHNYGARCYCCPHEDSRLFYGSKENYIGMEKEIIDYPFTPQVKEVTRVAKVGEWVKVVDKDMNDTINKYQNGDILQIVKVNMCGAYWKDEVAHFLREREYVVLENYQPPKEESNPYTEVKRNAIKGDWVKVVDMSSCHSGEYSNGDVFQIISTEYELARFAEGKKRGCERVLVPYEYVVLEGYVPNGTEKKFEEKKYTKEEVLAIVEKALSEVQA